jgi:hypothetical protein
MQTIRPRAIRALALLFALLTVLLPWTASAGKHSMIPPGQEQRIREFVDAALSAARAADEVPVAFDERISIGIDRDRIRVILHALQPADEPLPRLVVFHPEALADGAGALAPGVILECGTLEQPSPCDEAIAIAWTPVAVQLARAREPVIEEVWQVEETGVQRREETPLGRTTAAVWIDRGAVIGAVVLGLALVGFAMRGRSASDSLRVDKWEFAALLGLLVLFVGATDHYTTLLPLHEHNSFIARSDCAIDERCVDDPAGAAWSMTTIHGYGLLLELIPYRAEALAWLSLGVSVIMLVLVWAVTRRLAVELGFSRLAGIAAVAVLASNPVVWRLSGAATFWPWALSWMLAAALAGMWAARAGASANRHERLAGAAAWVLAATCLAFAAAGNVVCLTLGACLVLGPVCWSQTKALRAAWIGPIALGVFALLVAPDYVQGYERAFGPAGIDDSLTAKRVIEDFNPLLLDSQIVTPVWALASGAALLLAVALRIRRRSTIALGALRWLVPLAYAWLLPAAFLGVAAHEVVGSGYPSGFINHHWELVFTAIVVGLVLGWLVTLHRLAWLLPAVLTVLAMLLAPRSREGWRMATGENVLERELVALEHSFAVLPEHDLLVVAPRILAPLTDAPSQWDPLEVVFPVGAYQHAMRERGLEPALVVSIDGLAETQTRPGERILLYIGSSLRSFQPHEIATGVVPDGLERPEVVRLRDAWAMEKVHEFVLRTPQHEAMSQRLAADRMAEIELGFYWLTPHRSPGT